MEAASEALSLAALFQNNTAPAHPQVDLYTTTFYNDYVVPTYAPNYTVIIPPGTLQAANQGLLYKGPSYGRSLVPGQGVAPAPGASVSAASAPNPSG